MKLIKYGDVLSQFWPGMLYPRNALSRERFVPERFHYKILGMKNLGIRPGTYYPGEQNNVAMSTLKQDC
jgi:hypothetical protein